MSRLRRFWHWVANLHRLPITPPSSRHFPKLALEPLEDRTVPSAFARAFVEHAYPVLLHRPLDESGLVTWTQQLDGGASTTQVVLAIAGNFMPE